MAADGDTVTTAKYTMEDLYTDQLKADWNAMRIVKHNAEIECMNLIRFTAVHAEPFEFTQICWQQTVALGEQRNTLEKSGH